MDRRTSIWLAALAVAACSHDRSSPKPPAPATEIAKPEASPDVPEAAPTEADAQSAAPAKLSGPTTRCADSKMCSLCVGNSSEPVLEIIMADTVHLSEDAETLKAAKETNLEYRVAIEKGQLAAEVFTCPRCRRRLGWGFRVAFDKLVALDDENRRALQSLLGFPETPLLGTAGDWRSAASIGAPKSGYALPGCKR